MAKQWSIEVDQHVVYEVLISRDNISSDHEFAFDHVENVGKMIAWIVLILIENMFHISDRILLVDQDKFRFEHGDVHVSHSNEIV